MPVHVTQWFLIQRIAMLAMSVLLSSDFNTFLVIVALPLVYTLFETVCTNIVIAQQSMDLGQSDMSSCVP